MATLAPGNGSYFVAQTPNRYLCWRTCLCDIYIHNIVGRSEITIANLMFHNFHVFLMTRIAVHPFAVYAVVAACMIELAVFNQVLIFNLFEYSKNSLAGACLIVLGSLLAYVKLTDISSKYEAQLFTKINDVIQKNTDDINNFKLHSTNKENIDLSMKRTLIILIIVGTIQNGLG